ncbi:MAG TPA: hypothetical protein VGQ55_16650, partial [Pyrinomonadaceae bacterium]|nr:hypothetical protein [Pyrinomonadaceae bacterium]
MKNLLLPFMCVLLLAFSSAFGQTRMTEAELLGYPPGTKTVIERRQWIVVANGEKSEEPSKEITVRDFNREGRLFLVREYGSEYGPARMEHHVFIGDREGVRMEPLKEIENVNEKTLPPAESYRAPKGIAAAALGETRLTYDNKGRITQVQRFKPNGELI